MGNILIPIHVHQNRAIDRIMPQNSPCEIVGTKLFQVIQSKRRKLIL